MLEAGERGGDWGDAKGSGDGELGEREEAGAKGGGGERDHVHV